MSVSFIRSTLIVTVVASAANVRSAVITYDSTAGNVNTLETINNVVNDLINQTAFIVVNITTQMKNRTSVPLISLATERILESKTHVTTLTTKEPDVDSQNENVESEEEYYSSGTEFNNDLQNDSLVSDDAVNSYNVPNFHLSIKINSDDSHISENLALLSHLNETIERLREFNDKYERLIADNVAIERNAQELQNKFVTCQDENAFMRNNDEVSTTRGRTIQLQQGDDPLSTADVTNSKTSEATTNNNNDDIISGIRANLMA